MKKVSLSLLIGTLVLLFPIFGFRMLVKHIYNRTDCERFNIDNIEVRTGINIPAVEDVICEFKATENTKVSMFTLNKSSLDFSRYIKNNDFVKEGDFYINRGKKADTEWEARLSEEDLKLTVSLVYK